MTIENASLNVGATSVSPTGGTATSFTVQGSDSTSAKMFLDGAASFAATTRVQLFTRDPKVNASAPDGYTQKRSTYRLLRPKALASGSITVNSGTIDLGVSVESTDAEILDLQLSLAQALADAALAEFWQNQSTK